MKYFYLINKDKNYNSKYKEISNFIITEKKSSFICYTFYISNQKEAQEYINKINLEYKDARHIVYIYSYLENNILNIKFSDDGEPQGTGTKAIYDMLVKENITNVCIVIVRYFGGVLLGAGPLSRAYLNSVRGAILDCNKGILYKYLLEEISLNYSNYDILMNFLEKYIKESLVIVEDTKFNENIELVLKIEEQSIDIIKDKIKELNA